MKFTISARGKTVTTPILRFLAANFGRVAIKQIDSVFGFVERCTLYGGRVFTEPELSDRDVSIMNELGIGLRLPFSNHYIEREEYERYRPLLQKYHFSGNSVIITSDTLAQWVREEFPGYQIEASVIKNIDTHAAIEQALALYDTVVLPMRLNQDPEFLSRIACKERITLFANAGCALTCPSKICYPSVSKANKFTGEQPRCSYQLKPREMLGMQDFDLEQLMQLGFHRFKMLRSRDHGLTGF
jgi:collagenase-like PrtC family protease